MYKSFVRPIIEYGDVVWHSGLTTKQSKINLEKHQKRACKTIFGINYDSFCGLSSLHDRRDDHCRTFASGLVDNERTKLLMPPSRKSIHGRDLRNGGNFSQLRHKTKCFQQRPIPYFVNLLNST